MLPVLRFIQLAKQCRVLADLGCQVSLHRLLQGGLGIGIDLVSTQIMLLESSDTCCMEMIGT